MEINSLEDNLINDEYNSNNKNQETLLNEDNFDPFTFNYSKHDYIGVSYAIISKLNNSKENTDIACLLFLETIIEKFPFLAMRRLIQPFCESIIDKLKIKTRIYYDC